MNKKILLLIISVMAAMVLAACASGGSGSTSSQAASSEPASSKAASSEATSSEPAKATSEETTTPVSAPAVDQRRVYVDADWVKSVIDNNQKGYEDYVIAEVTYSEDPKGDYFTTGHIPGAIQIFDVEVEDAEGTKEAPYNLLPAEEVEKNLLSHGITKDTKVILYGSDPAGTGRVAYAYLWAGVEDVKILNGGVDAWTAAGYDLETDDTHTADKATDFGTKVPAHPEFWVSMDDAKTRLTSDDNFKLVSIRSEPEWLGETSGYGYIDRAGEPEGAVWGKGAQTAFDVADFVDSKGAVKELSDIEKVWADCDFSLDNHLSFYCGTGWRATVPFLVLYQENYNDISVYDGGWYEWQMYDDNPVQVGDPASSTVEHVTVKDLPTDKAAKE